MKKAEGRRKKAEWRKPASALEGGIGVSCGAAVNGGSVCMRLRRRWAKVVGTAPGMNSGTTVGGGGAARRLTNTKPAS